MLDRLPLPVAASWRRTAGPLLLLTGLTLLFAAPWLPQGLDFTDDGFHLTNQAGLRQNEGLPRDRSGATTWVSDLLGAACMPRDGSPDLLRQRVGWLLLILSTAAAAWLLALSVAAPSEAAIATALAVPVSLAYSTRMLVDYNRAPFLLVVAGLAIPRLGGRAHPGWLRALLGGVILGLAVLARLPGLPVVLLPFLPPLLWRVIDRRWDVPRLREALVSLAGSGLIAILFFSVFGVTGVPVPDPELHRLSFLIPIYLRQSAEVAAFAVAWTLGAWLVSRVPCAGRWARGIACSAIVVLTSLLSVAAFWWTEPERVSVRLVFIAVGGCLAALMGGLRRVTLQSPGGATDRLRPATELLLLGLAAAFLSCLGSNNGLAKMTNGLILPIPAAFLLALALLEGGRSIDATRRCACWTVFLMLATAGVVVRAAYPYRDHPDRRVLRWPIDHPGLAGIRTGAQRAHSVEQLLAAVGRECSAGDSVLAYGGIPMLHYLSATRPALDFSWPDLLPPPELQRRLGDLDRGGRRPCAVVRARVDVTNRLWAYEDTGPPRRAAQVRTIDRWRAGHGFVTIWSNPEFVVYASRE